MDISSAFIIYLAVFRLAIIGAGVASIMLSYRLFIKGYWSEGALSKRTRGSSVTLKHAGPGVFFALLGVLLIGFPLVNNGEQLASKMLKSESNSTSEVAPVSEVIELTARVKEDKSKQKTAKALIHKGNEYDYQGKKGEYGVPFTFDKFSWMRTYQEPSVITDWIIPYPGVGTIYYVTTYGKYREGVIKRHIAANGRYLQYIWLRTMDFADSGEIEWAGADLVPSVIDNVRASRDGSNFTLFWVPVIFYEILPRKVPTGYVEQGILGYVSVEPEASRVPLYEWVHNTIREQGSDLYVDHYYSTNLESRVAKHRYHNTGIVGYLLKDAAPGFIPLYVAFNTNEKNHILFTEKAISSELKNMQFLGYIKTTPGSQGHFDVPFKEYRRADDQCAICRDNFYSAVKSELVPIQVVRAPRGKKGDLKSKAREELGMQTLEVPTETLEVPTETLEVPMQIHFLARQVIAGGGDNPLYEGGLALATFSLEHIHQVSPHSLDYARKLFEFIEASEEQNEAVLVGGDGKTGHLRRNRHAWKDYPQDQQAGGQRWAASTDELVGTIMGLWYFIKATEGVDPTYNTRAKNLLGRIADYLLSHKWVYADSRISPVSIENYVAEAGGGENSMISYGLGTLVFQYAFARIFKEILGDPHSSPATLAETKEDALELLEAIGGSNVKNFASFVLGIYPISACLAELITEFTDKANFVLGCGRTIDTHGKIFELLIENMYPYAVASDYEKFYNNTMLLYTSWMVLNSPMVGGDRKKTFAKKLLAYIHAMWGGWPSKGIARRNLLFAVLAKRCLQLLSTAEARDALDISEKRTIALYNFIDAIDGVIHTYGKGPSVPGAPVYHDYVTWQPDLPLGEPKWTGGVPHSPLYPWETSWPTLPGKSAYSGIGRNQAWQYGNPWTENVDNFAFWHRYRGSRHAEDVFSEVGPWYTDAAGNWLVDKTIENLRRYARVGYRDGDPEFYELCCHGHGPHFKVEAGGNDLMFMRMLLTEMGITPPPELPDKNVKYKTLPIAGESPW